MRDCFADFAAAQSASTSLVAGFPRADPLVHRLLLSISASCPVPIAEYFDQPPAGGRGGVGQGSALKISFLFLTCCLLCSLDPSSFNKSTNCGSAFVWKMFEDSGTLT